MASRRWKWGILVSLGCHNRIPQIRWLTWQTFIPHCSRGRKSQVRHQHGQVLGKGLLLAYRYLPSYCVLTRQRIESSGLSSPYKGTTPIIPFTRAPPSGPNYLPKAPPNIFTLGVRISKCEFWRETFSLQRCLPITERTFIQTLGHDKVKMILALFNLLRYNFRII